MPYDDYYFDDPDGGGGGYVPPAYSSADWARIADLTTPAGRTDYRSVNFGTQVPDGARSLNGTYTVLAVSASFITLSNPELVAPAWANIVSETAFISATLSTTGERWIGPFIIEGEDTDRLIANFVALNGLFKDDGQKVFQAFPITVEVELTPVNAGDIAIGPAESFFVTVDGNTDKDKRDIRAATLWCDPTFTGRMSVRARRVTPTDLAFKGSVVDEVKWRDLFGTSPADLTELGDVTTIHTRTYATASALSVKERKLSMKATRRLPQRMLDGTFSEELFATRDFADIICALARDPAVGGLSDVEVDFENIYAVAQEVEDYFGTAEARSFGYTFDDDQLSAEESIAIVAQACFSTAYRRGRVLRLVFERATEDSSLLFNRRNVIPGSYERTTRFGILKDQDGVELDYPDLAVRKVRTYFIPPDRSALKPRTAQVPGLSGFDPAYWHAWRDWNRMRYQNIGVQFEATQEAGLILRTERVLVSDMTRPERYEGEVEDQDGLQLRLSDPVDLDPMRDWVCFLQHVDGTTEAIGVTSWVPGVDEDADLYRVVLDTMPRLDLIIDSGVAVGTAKFMIATSDDGETRAFIVTEREPQSGFTERVSGVNYSFLYYQNDQLALWLPIFGTAVEELSVNRLAVVEAGAVVVALSEDRGKKVIASEAGTGLTFPDAAVAPASYTKAGWVMIDVDAAANLLGNASEFWGPDGTGNFVAHHGAGAVSLALPGLGEWHHWAAAYDAVAERLTLTLDGVAVDQQAGVARGTLAAPTALNGLQGQLDDLRLWTRALTRRELLDVYRGGLTPATAHVLRTEAGSTLLTEDGQTLIWE